jgi:hypothetical protein|tara:strand:+ start:696 stop:2507 length:1812 start_codon:yes stop_codon:yes gene_type:complete
MPSRYGFAHFEKLKSHVHLKKAWEHNERRVPIPNARSDAQIGNVNFTGFDPDVTYRERVEWVLIANDIDPDVTADQVRLHEWVLTASPEYFEEECPDWRAGDLGQTGEAWVKANIAFFKKQYPETVVGVHLHLDESTPHLHLMGVPLVEVPDKKRGAPPKSGTPAREAYDEYQANAPMVKRLSSSAKFGGSLYKMHDFQNQYHNEVCQAFGLERGHSKAAGSGERAYQIPPAEHRKMLVRLTEAAEADRENARSILEDAQKRYAAEAAAQRVREEKQAAEDALSAKKLAEIKVREIKLREAEAASQAQAAKQQQMLQELDTERTNMERRVAAAEKLAAKAAESALDNETRKNELDGIADATANDRERLDCTRTLLEALVDGRLKRNITSSGDVGYSTRDDAVRKAAPLGFKEFKKIDEIILKLTKEEARKRTVALDEREARLAEFKKEIVSRENDLVDVEQRTRERAEQFDHLEKAISTVASGQARFLSNDGRGEWKYNNADAKAAIVALATEQSPVFELFDKLHASHRRAGHAAEQAAKQKVAQEMKNTVEKADILFAQLKQAMHLTSVRNVVKELEPAVKSCRKSAAEMAFIIAAQQGMGR